MASLYEIDEKITSCIDPETGEIIDIELWETEQLERETKLENIACWIKNLLSDAEAYRTEKEAFAERERQARAKAEGLKIFLGSVLGGRKFSTAKCAVSFRASTAVEVNGDVLPREWCSEKVTYSPNRLRIKAAIESGQAVPGARLAERLNIQIK